MIVSVAVVSVLLFVIVPKFTVGQANVVPLENDRLQLYAITVPERNWRFEFILSV